MKANGNINSILQLVTDFNESRSWKNYIEMPLEREKQNIKLENIHRRGMFMFRSDDDNT